MGTRSTISILHPNNTIQTILCKFDGALPANGLTLWAYYQDAQKVNDLIALGDVCSLDVEITLPPGQKHSVRTKIDGYSTFFSRDNDTPGFETTYQAYTFKNFDEYTASNLEAFNYIYKERNRAWYHVNPDTLKISTIASSLSRIDMSKNYRASLYEETVAAARIVADKKKISRHLSKSISPTSSAIDGSPSSSSKQILKV